MLVLIALLAHLGQSLDNIPKSYSTDPPITSLGMIPVTHVLNPYTGSDPYIYIFYQPYSSSIVFSYVQAAIDSQPNTATNYSNMNSVYFDQYGYSRMRDQLIVLRANNTISNISVSIFVTFSDSSAPLNLNYNLIVNTSLDAPCPNSCTGNGDCLSTGECQCRNDFYGKDCSIHPDNLEITHPASHDIQYKEYYYTKVPSSSLGTKVTITVQKHGGSCKINLYFKYTASTTEIVSPFSNGKNQLMDIDNNYFFSYLNQYSADLWILFWNEGPSACHLDINLAQDSSLGVLLVIIIVVGISILVALVLGVIFMLRRRRELNRIGSIEQQRNRLSSKNLTGEDIDRYFPVVDASVVGVQQTVDDPSFDLVPTKDCVICLCPIESNDKIRITYCNHIFHKDCLAGWFLKTQNCPYCRQNFDKQHTMQLYDEIVKNSRKKSSKSQQLQGQKLASQISKYQKSKSLLVIEHRQTIDKIDTSFMSMNDDLG